MKRLQIRAFYINVMKHVDVVTWNKIHDALCARSGLGLRLANIEHIKLHTKHRCFDMTKSSDTERI